MATEAQIAANRANGLKGGVKTEAGKAISRLNARKHGIFALALTAEDAAQLRGIEDELAADLKPVGVMEEILVEKLALTFMRMRRCARMEAEHYRLREQYDAAHGRMLRDQLIVTLGHYDIRLTNQFLRLSHELERLRTMARKDDPHGSAAAPLSISRMTQIFSTGETKNEPIWAASPTEPPTTTQQTLDSRLRGNDNQEMKNEPNSAINPAEPPAAEPPATTEETLDSRLRENDNQEMKNEPNVSQPAVQADDASVCASGTVAG